MNKTNGFVTLLGAIAACASLPAMAWANGPGGARAPHGDGVVRVSDPGASYGIARALDESGVPPAPDGVPLPPPAPAWPGGPAPHVYEPMVMPWDGGVPYAHECPPHGLGGAIYDEGLADRWHLFGSAPWPARRGWFAGGGVVFLEADFDATTAFFVQDATGPVDVITSREFDYDFETGFRVWLGWQDGTGLAYRVTYFDYDASESVRAVAPSDFVFFLGLPTPTAIGRLLAGGTAGDVVTARSSFHLYYIDAEITQELNFDRWQTTFGGGYRHVGMAQRYRADATAGGLPVTSRVGQRFDGNGPTIFSEVRIPFIGVKDRRFIGSASLSLVGHTRGSIVFGDTKLTASDINPTLPGVTSAVADLRDSDSMAIGEIRVGAQFDVRPIDGSLITVIVAYEAQWLQGANDFANINQDNDLSLHGFYFALGVDW